MKGHVRARGKGNWYAVIDVRDRLGRRKRKWQKLLAKNKRDALTECATLIATRDSLQIDATKETLCEFLRRWLKSIKTQVELSTYERYKSLCNKNIAPLIGHVRISKLRPEQIAEAYSTAINAGRCDGRGGLSKRTVLHMHRVLRQALQQAVVWRIIASNPADAVKPPRPDKKAMQVYDIHQTAAALETLREHRIFIPALIGFACGLRRGEIVALRWRAIDLDTGSIAVQESAQHTKAAGVVYKPTKSDKGRNIKMPAFVIDELRAWRLRQAEEFLRLGVRPTGETFLVTKEDGNPIQPRSLTHGWRQMADRLGTIAELPRIRLHDTRHSHATHMLSGNIHPKIVSERLGHSKVGITLDLYSHILPGMQDGAAAMVDDTLRSALKLANKKLKDKA